MTAWAPAAGRDSARSGVGPRAGLPSAAVSRGRLYVTSLAVVALLPVVLVGGQLVLPGIAASRVRDRLGHDGSVQSVDVSAFPAVELLWGRADSVKVRMNDMHVSRSRTAELLSQARGAGSVDVTIGRLDEGLLVLHDVTLRKRGDAVAAAASVSNSDLQAALPPGFAVQPVASGGGQLVLRASASLFGLGLAVNALVSAQNGALVAQPVGVPFGSLATLTLFADPRVAVEGVGARTAPGGFQLSASGRLTG